jgi:hypothetical protein
VDNTHVRNWGHKLLTVTAPVQVALVTMTTMMVTTGPCPVNVPLLTDKELIPPALSLASVTALVGLGLLQHNTRDWVVYKGKIISHSCRSEESKFKTLSRQGLVCIQDGAWALCSLEGRKAVSSHDRGRKGKAPNPRHGRALPKASPPNPAALGINFQYEFWREQQKKSKHSSHLGTTRSSYHKCPYTRALKAQP